MSINKKIFSIIRCLEGEIGLYFEDLQTGEKLTINSDNIFPAASTIKIPLVLFLFQIVEDGMLDLNDVVSISKDNRVMGTGIIKDLNENYKPTILDLATLCITVSDNIAANQIIDLVGGTSKVNEFCKKIGLSNTRLQRKMLDIEAIKAGKDNYTTAGDMGSLLRQLGKNKIVSKQVSERVIEIMKTQQFRQKLPALIPAVTSYDPNVHNKEVVPGTVVVANKTGDLRGVQNDVGIFIMPGNNIYILAILICSLAEDSQGIEAIAKISKVVYEEMKKKYR